MKKVEDMVHTISRCPNLTTFNMGDFVLNPVSMGDCSRFASALLSLKKLKKLQMSSLIFGNYIMEEDCLEKFPQLRHLTLTFPLFVRKELRPFRDNFNFKKFSVSLIKSRVDYMKFKDCYNTELYSILECFKSNSVSRGVSHALTIDSRLQTDLGCMEGNNTDDARTSELSVLTAAKHVDSERDHSSVLKCLSISVLSLEESAEEVDAFFAGAEFKSIANLLVHYYGQYEVKEIRFLSGKRTSQ